MKKTTLLFLIFSFFAFNSFIQGINHTPKGNYGSFSTNLCKSGHNGEVQSGDLYQDGIKIGYVISLNRTSKRLKAKYFAYKDNGTVVDDRYNSWRIRKSIVLVSSGAYGNSFSGADKPVGFTVDNGKDVNLNIGTKMDGLVIVEAVGGIRVSNIEDGDLVYFKGETEVKCNVKNYYQRSYFLTWCHDEKATVFQTHLLAYKNQLKFNQSDTKVAERKLLVLAKDRSGNVFHFIVYSKFRQLTLFEMAYNTLNMFTSYGYEVVAAVNLDTGWVDVLATSTELSDCNNTVIEGLTNNARRSMTNMLSYYYE